MQDKGKIPWAYIVPALVIVAVIVGAIYIQSRNNATTSTGILPPHGAQNYQAVLGTNFACESSESLFMHIHPWLEIVINGKNVTIPPGIGIINPAAGGTYNGEPVLGGGPGTCFEPVHTH